MDIKHFTFYEFIKSNQNLAKCFKDLPESFTIIKNLVHLASLLEELRRKLGKPIYVNSGFRSEQYNKRVGGVPGSYHTRGRAVDIRADNIEDLRCLVLDCCGFTGSDARPLASYVLYENENYEVCLYPNFIHLAFKYEIV